MSAHAIQVTQTRICTDELFITVLNCKQYKCPWKIKWVETVVSSSVAYYIVLKMNKVIQIKHSQWAVFPCHLYWLLSSEHFWQPWHLWNKMLRLSLCWSLYMKCNFPPFPLHPFLLFVSGIISVNTFLIPSKTNFFFFPKHLIQTSSVVFVAFYYNYRYFSFSYNYCAPPMEGNLLILILPMPGKVLNF